MYNCRYVLRVGVITDVRHKHGGCFYNVVGVCVMAAAVRDAFQRDAGSITTRGNTLWLPPVIPLSVPILFNHLRIFPGPGSGFGVQNKRQLNENKITKRER